LAKIQPITAQPVIESYRQGVCLMSENPENKTPEVINPENTNPVTSVSANLMEKLTEILKSWQFKVGIVLSILLAAFFVWFFWPHLVAVQGMKNWSDRAGAEPIECMIKDTNDDQYVSCSAMLKDQVVPLECGSSIFNIGCRINYGTAASPNTRQVK
jgi:hypothetical protein